jgi:hypothetical protein
LEREHDNAMRIAWCAAVFTRWRTGKGGKPFPKLERLLISGRKPKAPQTPEQMLQIAKMMTVAFGGTVVKRAKET